MEKLIIALVVVIAAAAHVILFRWVKFKIDEGVVLQFLRDANDEGLPNCHSTQTIAAHTNITAGRVLVICSKSGEISPHAGEDGNWQLG